MNMNYHTWFHKVTAYWLTENYSSVHSQLHCTYVSCATSNSSGQFQTGLSSHVRLLKMGLQGLRQTKPRQLINIEGSSFNQCVISFFPVYNWFL